MDPPTAFTVTPPAGGKAGPGAAPPSEEPLAPVSAPARRVERSALAWVVGLSAASIAVLALAAAVVFFSEFVATDRDALQLLQAAVLSFGVPALMIGPYALVAWWALRGGQAPRVWTTVLMAPWVVVAGIWVWAGRFDPALGVVPGAVAVLAIAFAFSNTKILNTR